MWQVCSMVLKLSSPEGTVSWTYSLWHCQNNWCEAGLSWGQRLPSWKLNSSILSMNSRFLMLPWWHHTGWWAIWWWWWRDFLPLSLRRAFPSFMEISPPSGRLTWGGYDAMDGEAYGWVRNGFILPVCRCGGSVNVTGGVTFLSFRAAGATPRCLFAEVYLLCWIVLVHLFLHFLSLQKDVVWGSFPLFDLLERSSVFWFRTGKTESVTRSPRADKWREYSRGIFGSSKVQ